MAITRARDRARALATVALGAMIVAASGCSSGGAGAAAGPTGLPSIAPTVVSTPSTPAATGVIPLPTELPISIDYEDAMRLFDYDRARPFDIVEKSVRNQGPIWWCRRARGRSVA